MSVKMTVDKLAALIGTINDLAKKEVMVGIPASDPGNRANPITNAEIGYILDKGSPAQNIPPRPFLVPGVADVQERCADKLGDAAQAALDGNKSGTMRALHQAGLIAESSVKAKINSNIQPALAESTLAKRRARGITRENTLVDSGGMRNSVTHVVRDKK